MCAPRPAQAAAYLQATAPEVEPQPDTASGSSLAERQRAFESGSAYQTPAPSTGAKRGTANQEKVKALQKAGIQDDPNKLVSAGNSQHKLAVASPAAAEAGATKSKATPEPRSRSVLDEARAQLESERARRQRCEAELDSLRRSTAEAAQALIIAGDDQ